MVPRRALANLLAAMGRLLDLSGGDRFLAVTTVSFDIAALELFVPLLGGATVVLAADDDVRDPFALAALIRSSGPTVMQATPSLWRVLVDADPGALGPAGAQRGRAAARRPRADPDPARRRTRQPLRADGDHRLVHRGRHRRRGPAARR